MNNFQIKIIEKAIERPETLTSWEYDFIESLIDKSDDYELSEKQNHILNKISEKL